MGAHVLPDTGIAGNPGGTGLRGMTDMEAPCVNCKRKIQAIGEPKFLETQIGGRGRPVLCQACVRSLGLKLAPPDQNGAQQVSYQDRLFSRPKGCNVFVGPVAMEVVRAEAPVDADVLPLVPRPDGPRVASKQVLVVDDDPDVLGVVGEALTQKGYAVERAEGAERALQLIEQRRFDLVVLDVVLPEHTGFVVLEGLRGIDRRRGVHTPVIMMTGQKRQEYRSLAARLDVAGFLTKPFPLQNLLIRSEEVLCA